MSKENKEGDVGRRDFLKLASISAPAAMVAVATSEAGASEVVSSKTALQDTAHTRAFYETARF